MMVSLAMRLAITARPLLYMLIALAAVTAVVAVMA